MRTGIPGRTRPRRRAWRGPPIDRQRIRDELTDIALEEDEVEVYMALLELGTSKARTVADAADIHRTTA